MRPFHAEPFMRTTSRLRSRSALPPGLIRWDSHFGVAGSLAVKEIRSPCAESARLVLFKNHFP